MKLIPMFPVDLQPIIGKALHLTNKILGSEALVYDLLVPVAELFCDQKEDQINVDIIKQCSAEDKQFKVYLLPEAQFLEVSGDNNADMCIVNREDVYVNVSNMPQAIDDYSFKSSVLFVMVVFLHEVLGHGCTKYLNFAANNTNYRTGKDTTPEKVGRLTYENDGVLQQRADCGFGFERIHFGGFLVCLHAYNTIANTVVRNTDLPMTDDNREFRIVGKEQASCVYGLLDSWDGVQPLDSSVFQAIRFENLPDYDIEGEEFQRLVESVTDSINSRFNNKRVNTKKEEAVKGVDRRSYLGEVRKDLKI